VLSGKVILVLVAMALYQGIVTFLLFKYGLGPRPANAGDYSEDAKRRARTVAFTGLVVIEMLRVFNFRALRFPLWRVGFFTNPKLIAAVAGSLALQVVIVYAPVTQRLLGTVSLSWKEWVAMVLVALPILIVPEAVKIVLSGRAAHTRNVRFSSDSASEA
jgi:Ca2+-transporting ATPase